MKISLFPKSVLFRTFQGFKNKIRPDSTLICWGKGENLQLEKRINFFNLLDLEILSLQVLTNIVGNLQNVSISKSLTTSAMVYTWPDSTLILGRGKDKNLGFEKRSDFLNLQDFQILSRQVLTRVVGCRYYLRKTLQSPECYWNACWCTVCCFKFYQLEIIKVICMN